ncbi:MAG: hypothetical protein AB8C95_08685 [Phycisphaeraceae bacterium]
MSLGSIREKLEDNQAVVMIGAGVLIAGSVILLILRLTAGGGAAELQTQATVIYYDLDQQAIKLVEHDTSTGPAASPLAGTENVFVAAVWYCGESQGASLSDGMTLEELEEAGLFIAWLEKNDDRVQANEYVTNPRQYRTLDDPAWKRGETPAVIAILEGPLDRCEDAAQYVVQ